MTEPSNPSQPPARRPNASLIRAIVDYAGLALFLVAFLATRNAITATWALVAGSAIGLIVGFVFERRIAPMPAMAGGAALLFGGLTIAFNDPVFLQIKPTVINGVFSLALFGGLVLRRNPLKLLLGEVVSLPDTAWRTLTWRYAFWFAAMAILNVIVWRTVPFATWVWFRFPGLMILTMLFSLAQIPLFMRHAPPDRTTPAE